MRTCIVLMLSLIVSLGFKPEDGIPHVGHQELRKLRFLCGRRKGSIALLGTLPAVSLLLNVIVL